MSCEIFILVDQEHCKSLHGGLTEVFWAEMVNSCIKYSNPSVIISHCGIQNLDKLLWQLGMPYFAIILGKAM